MNGTEHLSTNPQGPRTFRGSDRPQTPSERVSRAECSLVAATEELRQVRGELAALREGLRHAQKLEALGHLAVGIAHEINTPSQYVGDSVWFVQEAMHDLDALLERYRSVARKHADPVTLDELDQAESAARLTYLQREVPDALASALGGIRRIDEIVSAMQSFAQPNRKEKCPTDLNKSIRTALTIARHAYKYVAEVEEDLGDIPSVCCHAGDIHQVLVALLLQATSAVEPGAARGTGLGRIALRSRHDACTDEVVIEVTDSGAGISEETMRGVFDPVCVARASGVGGARSLYIARQIVVQGHGGSLAYATDPGCGTTFTLRLPREGSEAQADREVSS